MKRQIVIRATAVGFVLAAFLAAHGEHVLAVIGHHH